MSKTKYSLAASLLLLLMPIAAWAQTTSSSSAVTGIVTDSSGAVITGATVTLTDTKTSKELTATSDDQGVYRFNQVQPGRAYKLTFTVPGFQTFVINDVALGVGTTESHNAQMSAGQVAETVEVTAGGEATLNVTDASIGNVIEQRRLVDLPVQIRSSPAALMSLQPGVVGNNVGTTADNRVGSVTGSRADQGNITVDGIDANDQATGQAFATSGNAPIDAIQEFRTVSTNPGASEGRSSGGQIQLITKSGTNEFHGSLREFNRTAATTANSFFNNRSGVERPQLTRNQFGGSIGGPVYFPRFGEGGDRLFRGRDKLFFFFDYEGRRDAQGVTYTRIVPLPHFREGGIAYLNNTPGCPTNARISTHPQCISFLTPTQVAALDPQGLGASQALRQFVNHRYPLPNDLSSGNGINTAGFRFNAPSSRADNNYTARMDWNITEGQRMFGRASLVRNLQTDTVNTVAQQFPGDPETGQIITRDRAWVVGHTWVATPSIVNQATVGVTTSVLEFPTPFAPAFPQSFTFGPLTAPFAGIASQTRTVPVPTFRDDVSWTSGSHGLQFGGVFKPIRQRTGLVNDFNFVGIGLGGNTASLNASLRPGDIGTGTTRTGDFDAAYAFLLGRVASVATRFNYDPSGASLSLGSGRNRDWRYNEHELYAQDNWRVRNDLTITYGVRWHIYPSPYEANGFQSIQDVDYETLINRRIANAAAGVSGPDAEPLLRYDLGGKANNARAFYGTDWNNFGPRLSFAWNPSFNGGLLGGLFGDRKTVLRGGGSVIYDRPGGAITFLQDQSTYIFDTVVSTNFGTADAVASLRNDPRFTGIDSVPVQNVAPTVTRPFAPFVANGVGVGTQTNRTNYAVDPNFKVPYSIQYSLGFQRELPGNFILEASYVGRQGRQLFALADAAQVIDFRDPASGQFMLAALNGLQAQINGNPDVIGHPELATPQPWLENQINAARAARGLAPCLTRFGVSCTGVVAANFAGLVQEGSTADVVQQLYANGLLRPNVGISSQFGTNAYVTNLGSSSYNGMLVSLRRRFSQGLQFDVNYTWSHAIDNQSTVTNTVTSGGLICDVIDLRVCRSDADFDIRHLVNVNGIWELPVGRGRPIAGDAPGWLNAIVGGWQVSGIFTARSGLPFSVNAVSWPRTFIYNGANGVPAVVVGDINALRGQINDAPGGTVQFFADPEAALGAVRFPLHGEVGNRNILRGPAFWNLDTAVLKNFALPWSESQRLQIRWEAYNALNHHSYGLPAVNLGTNTFGQITASASTARVMQFGIRYDF